MGRTLGIWYDARYRLPLPEIDAGAGFEPRRADLVAWYLDERPRRRLGRRPAWRAPRLAGWDELGRVHTRAHLESLAEPESLARIFAVAPTGLPVDEILVAVRLACGATIDAARESLRTATATLNLFGGFHHAAPDRGGGFCAANDIAVAVAAVRADGFAAPIAVIDLDAHPPDGTAACLAGDAACWVGSLSGSDWGPLPGRVDETVLPERCGDEAYLDALDALLARMPKPALAFVVAGGDVLAGDRLGVLGLSLAGARRRDARVAEALAGVPSVWLPAGGYHVDSWRVLAGTALVLLGRAREAIAADASPLAHRFRRVASGLIDGASDDDFAITTADVEGDLGVPQAAAPRLLGVYTAAALELGFDRLGLFEPMRRLGYGGLHVVVDRASAGDRMRVLGTADGQEHVLVEVVVQRGTLGDAAVLFVNWLALRHPRAQFLPGKPRLPGQDVPGLGLAREADELLALVARRLHLAAVVIRPAWYHVAYAARHHFAFVDPARQARFEALMRELAGVSLVDATTAVAEGRARLGGRPYTWEPDEMAYWLVPRGGAGPVPQ